MSFSSVSFFVFMIAVFLIYWGIPHKFRYILLIFANLSFYICFSVKFVPVLLCEVTVAYLAGIILEKHKISAKKGRGFYLALSIVLILIPLLISKYLNFSIYAVTKVLSRFSVPVDDFSINIIAPIGISFYTFELLSYVVDVYKGKIKAERDILRLFVFASFFPNITSGPIERIDRFLHMLDEEKTFDYDRTVYGLRLILLGMIKKICGADVLKQYVDAVFSNVFAYKGPVFIVAIVLYTFEIYLDFAGYTDMARGVAYTLGFELIENFKAPYLSNGIKEFFARWHISLSEWLRDYIYIPLGGSRCKKVKKYFNLMITFLVSGIWHGASFTFIVWGLLHGMYQVIADAINSSMLTAKLKRQTNISNANSDDVNGKAKDSAILKACRITVTFILVSFAWMFFRANSLSDAKYIATNMIIGSNFYGQMLQMGFLKTSAYISVIVIIALTIVYDIASEKLAKSNSNLVIEFGRLNIIARWIIYVVSGVLVVVLRSHIGSAAEFIYFKF